MREPATPEKIRELIDFLGRKIQSTAKIYLCSGTSVVLWGLRKSSLDVDLKVEGEGIGEILREAKNTLNINIEPEHPGLFIPLLSGWRERSPFIEQSGTVTFFHMDPYSVVISKLKRAEEKDLADVQALIKAEKVDPEKLCSLYFDEGYQNQLQERFEIDIDQLTENVERFTS